MLGMLPFGFFNTITGESAQNLFENFFSGGFASAFNLNNTFKTGIKETEREYIICAELPGVNRSDIKFRYKNNYFTIAVIKRAGAEQSGNNFRIVQSCCGQTSRSFYVENINIKLIKAGFKGDILVIRLPKTGKLIEADNKILIK